MNKTTSSINYGELFAALRQPSSANVSASARSNLQKSSRSVSGLVLSKYKNLGMGFSAKIRVDQAQLEQMDPVVRELVAESPDGTLVVSIRRKHANIGVLDKILIPDCSPVTRNNGQVRLQADRAELIQSYDEAVAQNDELLRTEHVPMPLPETGKGRPFIVYVTGPGEPVGYEGVPGLFREASWELDTVTAMNRDGVQEKRIRIVLTQHEWSSEEQLVSGDTVCHVMQLTVWNNLCNELGLATAPPNLISWSALIKAHPIPFYAAVSVHGDYTPAGSDFSLAPHGVRWAIKEYLQQSGRCPVVSLDTVKELIADSKTNGSSAIEPPHLTVLNVTGCGRLPAEPDSWEYYAMTSVPELAPDEASLKQVLLDDHENQLHVVVWAVRQPSIEIKQETPTPAPGKPQSVKKNKVATNKRSKKRRKTGDKKQKGNQVK